MAKEFTPKRQHVDLMKNVGNTVNGAEKVRIVNATSREGTVTLEGSALDTSMPETNSSADLTFDGIKGTGFRTNISITGTGMDADFTSSAISGAMGSNYSSQDVLVVEDATKKINANIVVGTVNDDGGITSHTITKTTTEPSIEYKNLSTTISGSGLVVTVNRDADGAYTVDIINGGTGYFETNRLDLPGSLLGTDTSALLQIGETAGTGRTVMDASIVQGQVITTAASYPMIRPTYAGDGSSDVTLNVTNTGGHTITATIGNNSGSGYRFGDSVRILGSVLGGTDGTDDAFFGFATVSSSGAAQGRVTTKYSPQIPITNNTTLLSNQSPDVVSIQPDSNRPAGDYDNISYTTSGRVSGNTIGTLNVDVGTDGGITDIEIETHGSNDSVGDVITIANSDLGDVDGVSDVTFKVRTLLDDNIARINGSFFMFGNSSIIIEKETTDKLLIVDEKAKEGKTTPASGFSATDITE